jgi:hypothetical protein
LNKEHLWKIIFEYNFGEKILAILGSSFRDAIGLQRYFGNTFGD